VLWMTDCAQWPLSTVLHEDSPPPCNELSWPQWQRDVLRVLRIELQDLVHHLCVDDVDWGSWHVFYEQGRTPGSAVNRALERDL
jgi:hypothetical protein